MTLVLLTSCGKCCVSKLRKAAETWMRRPRKTPENWRESYYDDHNFFINWKIILTFLSSGAIFLRNKTRILEAMVVWLMLIICLTVTSMGISGERHARARKRSLSQEDQITWRLSRKRGKRLWLLPFDLLF